MPTIVKNLFEKVNLFESGSVTYGGIYQPNYDTTIPNPVGTTPEKVETVDIPGVVTGVEGLESEDPFKGGNAKVEYEITPEEKAEMAKDVYGSINKNIDNITDLQNFNLKDFDKMNPDVLIKDFDTAVTVIDDALYLYSAIQTSDSQAVEVAVTTVASVYATRYKQKLYDMFDSWLSAQKAKVMDKIKNNEIRQVLDKFNKWTGVLNNKQNNNQIQTHLANLDINNLSNDMQLNFKEGQMEKTLMKTLEDTIFNSINNSNKLLSTIAPSTESKLEILKNLHKNRNYSGLLNSLSYLQNDGKNSLKPLFLKLIDQNNPDMSFNDKIKYANGMVSSISSNSEDTLAKTNDGEVGKFLHTAQEITKQINNNKNILTDNYLR